MKQIKKEVIYHTEITPVIEVFVLPVCEGVWHVYLDWYEALNVEAFGGGDDYESIYLSHPASHEIDVEVKLYLPEDGFLFGGQSKKSYHGTYYLRGTYEKILEQIQ
jgi:hypothetical protein